MREPDLTKCKLCNKELEELSPELQAEIMQDLGDKYHKAVRLCNPCGEKMIIMKSLMDQTMLKALAEILEGEEPAGGLMKAIHDMVVKRTDGQHPHCDRCHRCLPNPTPEMNVEFEKQNGRPYNPAVDAIICTECGPIVDAHLRAEKAILN